ncbi:MAG: hypothetical protein H7222_10640 [Methylotenera sp.]|nr:hypothetical protein [Oligoflexia bacterium]
MNRTPEGPLVKKKPAKKATAKKIVAKKTATKKTAVKKAPAMKTAPKKAAKASAKKTASKKVAKKAAPAKKAVAKSAGKKSPVTLGWLLMVEHTNGDADMMVCTSKAEQQAYADELGAELIAEGKVPGKDFQITMSAKAEDIAQAMKSRY